METLKSRRWFRRLCTFFKIMKTEHPRYLFELIPIVRHSYSTRNSQMTDSFRCRTDFFKNSFFPFSLSEWNKLDPQVRNIESFMSFRKSLLNFIRPSENSIFNIHNPIGIKLLSRLRLGLSHLNDHKFKHNFQDRVNPLCSCSLEPETTSHYFLRCHHFCDIRTTLVSEINLIYDGFCNLSDEQKTNTILYGDSRFEEDKNSLILTASINYILESERFSGPLFVMH